jgi:hypothetical protein
VTDRTPGSHVAEDNLECVRDFLRREFRDGQHEDYFDQAAAVQVFRIDAARGLHHTLIIPKATFEHVDFGLLCNAHLVDALRGAGDAPVMLTPEGWRITKAG